LRIPAQEFPALQENSVLRIYHRKLRVHIDRDMLNRNSVKLYSVHGKIPWRCLDFQTALENLFVLGKAILASSLELELSGLYKPDFGVLQIID
jgi:hypothetical protein